MNDRRDGSPKRNRQENLRLDRAIVPRYTDYTLLTTSIDYIYVVLSNQIPFRKLDPIKLEKAKRNASKYYQFH